jgi:hypothetical protein
MQREQVVAMAWEETSYLATLLETPSDLRQYHHKDFELMAGDHLDSVVVPAPPCPDAANILGGPVYISVG